MAGFILSVVLTAHTHHNTPEPVNSHWIPLVPEGEIMYI